MGILARSAVWACVLGLGRVGAFVAPKPGLLSEGVAGGAGRGSWVTGAPPQSWERLGERGMEARWRRRGRVTSTRGEAEVERRTRAAYGLRAKEVASKMYSKESRIIVNTLLVATVLSYCSYELLTVDSDLWRGWSSYEVMLRLLPDNWAAYEGAVSATPLLSKSVLNFGTYCIGDWVAQMAAQKTTDEEEAKNAEAVTLPFRPLDFDLPRALRNGLIGASLGPMCHYYYEASEWLIPSDPDWHKPLKVLMDQTLWSSVWNGAYYLLLNLSQGASLELAVADVKAKWWPLLSAGWKLWPAAHIITYGLVPTRHRLLWVDAVDLVWCSVLASFGAEHGASASPNMTVTVDQNGVPLLEEDRQVELPGTLLNGLENAEVEREAKEAVEDEGPHPFIETDTTRV